MRSEKTEPEKEKDPPGGLIGEMMLAKTVLEEKNELLDCKDRTILELREAVCRLEAEVKSLRSEREEWREDGRLEGGRQVVAEVARMAAEHLPREADHWDLASRLIRHFRDHHGLEVIEGAAGAVNPELHQVVEVVEAPAGDPTSPGQPVVEILARGFRLDGRTVQPALVRVVRGRPAEGLPGGSSSWQP